MYTAVALRPRRVVSSLPRLMSLLLQTYVFDHKAFAMSLMTFGTPSRSIHFAHKATSLRNAMHLSRVLRNAMHHSVVFRDANWNTSSHGAQLDLTQNGYGLPGAGLCSQVRRRRSYPVSDKTHKQSTRTCAKSKAKKNIYK